MKQTLREHRALRRTINHLRMRAPRRRSSKHVVRAAHPRIAGALAAFGTWFANAWDSAKESWLLLVVCYAVATALLWANAEGLLP